MEQVNRGATRHTIILFKNKAILAETCKEAVSFLDRTLGLIGKTSLSQGEGLWIRQCRSIHMWFMRIAIDVVFVAPGSQSDRLVVVAVHTSVQPWTFWPITAWRATDVFELPAGTVQRCTVQIGDELCLSSPSSPAPTEVRVTY